jgi:hypothetical protein
MLLAKRIHITEFGTRYILGKEFGRAENLEILVAEYLLRPALNYLGVLTKVTNFA